MHRSRLPIDDIDRVILRHLQAEGRITNVDLAERAGLTAPPPWNIRPTSARGASADRARRLASVQVTVKRAAPRRRRRSAGRDR